MTDLQGMLARAWDQCQPIGPAVREVSDAAGQVGAVTTELDPQTLNDAAVAVDSMLTAVRASQQAAAAAEGLVG
jgi:hypothetical protein